MSCKLSKVVLILCVSVAVSGFGFREVEARNIENHDLLARRHHPSVDRFLVEIQNDTESALTLRTERVDPLDDLRKYRGGFNITNKHYWSSTIFTGKFGYIIAALWIVAGLIYAIILLISSLCFNRKKRTEHESLPYHRKYNVWPIVFGILFTLVAIIASGVALGGSTEVHSRARAVKNIIVDAANNASGTIYTISKSVEALQSNPQIYAGLGGNSNLNSTLTRLNVDAGNIQSKALSSMRKLNTGIKIVNLVTIVTVTVNLIAILALLASRPFLKLRRVFNMLIFLCWILTALFWLFFGLFYFLNKFSGDACAALDEYQQNPANSTLSSILPCNDRVSSKTTLHDVGSGIYNIIDQANSRVSSAQLTAVVGSICNPFSGPPEYNYQPQNCSSDTTQIGDIPQILKTYKCSNETYCNQGQFILPNNYSTIVVYTSSVQGILDVYPTMESLVDCHLVKDAFSKVLVEDCKPLKKYVHRTWASFAALSTVMVLLLVVWTVEARCGRRRCYYDGSVKPHSTPTESSDVDESEVEAKRVEYRMEP